MYLALYTRKWSISIRRGHGKAEEERGRACAGGYRFFNLLDRR